jgi:hypothetical protein
MMIDRLRQIALRFLAHFRAPALDSDLDAEMASHLQFAIEDNVQRGVLANTLKLTALGITVGVFASILCSQIMTSLLFRTEPNDPATFLAVTFLLVAVAIFAGYIPALRATRIHPAVALRCE